MSAGGVACAPSGPGWQSINWVNASRQVRKLQARIVKATQDSRFGKVKALQWLLTHSFSGKSLAVKRVIENDGKSTPGVDHVIWNTSEAKTNAIVSLQKRGYKPLPFRRVLIPKKQDQDQTARYFDHERPGYAGSLSASSGTHCRNDCRSELLRVQTETLNCGCRRTMFYVPCKKESG